MHRFFVDNIDLQPGALVDLSSLHHQLTRVLRLQPNDEIVLLDGRGRAARVQLQSLEHGGVGRVLAAETAWLEPAIRLTLYQCALKADKFEWVLQKGTELGISRFVPVISRRTIVRPAARLTKRYARWRRVIREAAEQSGRSLLPQLADPLSFDEAAAEPSDLRLLPWEEASRSAPGLGAQLGTRPASISLMVGPEGGLDAAEIAFASDLGWHTVSLGPRILRAETAALAAVTIILDRMDQLGAP